MRKYPRLTYGEWQLMSPAEKRSYSQLALAESQMLRAAKEEQRKLPIKKNVSRTLTHKWFIDCSAKSVSGPYSYSVKDDRGTNSVIDERVGITNPLWRKQVSEHQNATTSYTRRSGIVRDHPGAVVAETIVSGDRRKVVLSGDFSAQATSVLSAPLAPAEQRARLDFYKKLKRTQHEFAGGVFLGEIRQTAALIRKPYQEIPRLINRYLNRASTIIRAPKKALTWTQRERKLSDAWLTTTFGLLPVVSDIEDAAGALASLLNQERQRRVKGIGSEEVTSNSYVPVQLYRPGDWSTGLGLAMTINVKSQARVIVRYTGGVRIRAVGPSLDSMPDLSRRFGVSISDFIPTIYELLPWSFLLDYVTSVGDVLNANAVSYADVAWQSRSELHTCDSSQVRTINHAETRRYSTNLVYCTGYLGGCDAFNYTYSRSNPGVVPLPVLEFRTNLSPIKVMNVLMLRRQITNALKPTILSLAAGRKTYTD